MLTDGYNRRPYVHGAVERLKIPGFRFTDGPRGVVMGGATCFPVSMARGATVSPECFLWYFPDVVRQMMEREEGDRRGAGAWRLEEEELLSYRDC